MIYKELKQQLEGLTEEQLEQQVVVINGDTEDVLMPSFIDISKEDIYWEHHGDCIGNLEEVKKQCADEGLNWEDEILDMVKCDTGTVTIHVEI